MDCALCAAELDPAHHFLSHELRLLVDGVDTYRGRVCLDCARQRTEELHAAEAAHRPPNVDQVDAAS